MKYDDCSWHERADRPAAKAIHIGHYLHWLIVRGLHSTQLEASAGADVLSRVRSGSFSGYDFLQSHCDGKLTDEDLSEIGNSFSSSYYEKLYYSDIDAAVPEHADSLIRFMETGDAADVRDRIFKMLDTRFMQWQNGSLSLPRRRGPIQSLAERLRGLFRK